MLQPVPQDGNYPALRYLALEPRQKTSARGPVGVDRHSACYCRLRCVQKCRKLPEINAVLTVVVVGVAFLPTALDGRHLLDDERLKPKLTCVRGQGEVSCNSTAPSSSSSLAVPSKS